MIPAVSTLEAMTSTEVLQLAIEYIETDRTAFMKTYAGIPPVGFTKQLRRLLRGCINDRTERECHWLRFMLIEERERQDGETRQ